MASRPAMRFAYADPPYIGQAKRHYANHVDFAGEVDHLQLIARLEADYPDGWALSCSVPSLAYLLRLVPEPHRVLAWVKPRPVFKPDVRPMFSWEPVILRNGRKGRDLPIVRDWVSASIVYSNHNNTRGSKPREFCFWLFEVLGVCEGDQLDDLFPGSGAVTTYLDEWLRQPRMFHPTVDQMGVELEGDDAIGLGRFEDAS